MSVRHLQVSDVHLTIMNNRPASESAVHMIHRADTHDLRRRVLRADAPGTDADGPDVVWDGDDAPGTVHFGVRVDGRIVAVSTWLDAAAPDGRAGVRLRGMATDDVERGRGHGSALLGAGCEHARRHGAHVVWANARVTALGFYERAGFEVIGPIFETTSTGLPHRLVSFDLDTPGASPIG